MTIDHFTLALPALSAELQVFSFTDREKALKQ